VGRISPRCAGLMRTRPKWVRPTCIVIPKDKEVKEEEKSLDSQIVTLNNVNVGFT